ncbi:ribosome rescue protein RqcH [Methanobacterium formicicum]|uniref:Archaeal Rqc2 homolog aRqcH n=1 Tax=Methanobacterium formicicum (strain DSM 3637 / PP1) TaxID=1204725 RepID=K2QDA6_METFP|nr:ribosome rescue protein RqcH [Methanobacterium formicicum]EKF86006.1 fibronectin-binding A domain-containing protein [Methanobacterium formicicum DSM 3637]
MKAMSNVDLYAISHELNELLQDARVQKAYQPTRDTVIIRFHVPGKGRVDVAFQAGLRVHTTQYPPENPKVPPSFPMLLRKHLKNATVKGVRQHNFDRILEIDIQKEHRFTLVVELFSQGNIILLDEENQIILPLKHRHAQGRKITSKEEYQYPEERGIHILNVELEDLKELFANSDSDLIRTLARSGLGGMYSEEIFLRSGVDKKQPANETSESEIESIYQSMTELFKPLKTFKFQPQIVKEVVEGEEKENEEKTGKEEGKVKDISKTKKGKEDSKTKKGKEDSKTKKGKEDSKTKKGKEDVLPLDILTYQNFHKERFETFNQAADEFYSGKVGADIKKVQEDIWAKEVGKYEKRLRIQEETLEKFQKTIVETKRKGNLIYSHYSEIQNLLDIIHQAREKFSWMEIASKLKKARKEGMVQAQIIQSMDKMGVLTLNLEGETVTVDANLEIPENAEKYYNKGKKAKRKIKGVNMAIERTKKDVERKRNKRELALERVRVPQKRVRKELKWFEKLRWFLSSDGFLVIGGRDAGTNEMVVKRHLDNPDIYLHSDIHGAPSVVIKKGEAEEIPESTIHEAGNLAASFSSAWSKGYGSQDVYWVHPDQVSKTPQSGEFVARGAFIIRGSRNYLRGIPLKIAVGIVDYEGERIMAGPTEAVSKYTDNYVVLKPGFTKKEEIARSVLRKIDPEKILALEDVIRVLPSGKCDFVEKGRK